MDVARGVDVSYEVSGESRTKRLPLDRDARCGFPTHSESLTVHIPAKNPSGTGAHASSVDPLLITLAVDAGVLMKLVVLGSQFAHGMALIIGPVAAAVFATFDTTDRA